MGEFEVLVAEHGYEITAGGMQIRPDQEPVA